MEKIIKASPLLTAALIFIGYWNLHFYYKYFDIQIYDFITTGEVIVSFFPIALYVFIVCAIVLFVWGMTYIQRNDKAQIKMHEDDFKLIKKIKSLFSKDTYKGDKWYMVANKFILHLIDVLSIIIFFLSLIAIIIYSLRILLATPQDLYKNYVPVLIGIIVAYVLITAFINKTIINEVYKINKKDIRNYLLIVEVLVLFFGIDYMANYKEATKILNGKPDYQISFKYNDSLYKTDTTLVYIGKTQNYLFIRNLQNNKNLIFRTDKIDKLELEQMIYTKK